MRLTIRLQYVILCVLSVVVILSPHVARHYYGGTMMGQESYYHARAAELISAGSFWDTLAYGGRVLLFDPYDYALALFDLIMPIETASVVLPLFLGIATALIFFNFLGRLGLDDSVRLISAAILISSPIFVYMFSLSTDAGLAVFLMLLSAALFISGKGYLRALSGVFYGLVCLFGPVHSLIAAASVVILGLRTKDRKRMYIALIAIILVTIVYQFIPNGRFTDVIPVIFDEPGFLARSISIFGAMIGFSIFSVLLAFVGMMPTWKNRRYYLYPGVLLLLVSFLLGSFYNVYLNFLICGLSAFGLKVLLERRWELRIVRDLTLFVLALGMLFVLVSYVHQLASSEPRQDLLDAMEWLKANTKPREVVLSEQSKGYWIEYYAQRPVVLDSLAVSSPDSLKRYQDVRAIFSSRNLDEATRLLRQYRVRFILIDSSMADLLVNDRKQQGLPFLLDNSERFKKAKEYSGIEIWEFFG